MTATALLELDFDTYPLFGAPRDEWLKVRQQGIGGSDAAAIVGLDRFKSPLTVYYDKRGELESDAETPATRWGHKLEQPIAEEFEERNGFVVAHPAALYQSKAWPYMLANPDRELYTLPELTPWGGLEIKTSRLDDDWRDNPPERVLLQTQHQAAVCGWERMAIAVLLHGRYYEQWIVERDEETIDLLARYEGEFWERVLEGNPPSADGHRSTTDTLDKLYRTARVGSELELDEEGAELMRQLAVARRMKAEAETDEDELANAVKALLGDHEAGTVNGNLVVTWKAPKSNGRRHNCPDCEHPSGAPKRRFLPREVPE